MKVPKNGAQRGPGGPKTEAADPGQDPAVAVCGDLLVRACLRMSPRMDDTNETLLLNLDEVAAHLRVSRRYVEQMAARGDLPIVRIGGNVRVRRADLVAWVKALPVDNATGAA